MGPADHQACEARYRELLDRQHDLLARLERLEENQLTIVDLLRDFRTLVRLVATRLSALDHRIDTMLARLFPFREAGERIARHFRN